MKIKGTKEVFGITGMSLGMGIVGSGLEGLGGTAGTIGTQLGQAGITGASFIKPAVNISMGGTVIGMLKGFGK
jgi:hypothetical protein